MKTYYVYILKCADKSYYTGVTNDIKRRILEHNAGEVSCYTKSRRPIKLFYLEAFSNILDAILMEKQIKGWSRKKKEALGQRNWNLLKKLSICHGSTSSP